jgi:ribonuclease R
MKFSIADLLANFPDEKSVTPKALEKKLECEVDEDQRKLQIALDALEKLGILEKERGRYRRSEVDALVEGKLRCSSKGFCFAIQDAEEAEDVYIPASQLNKAWNGDRVLVKVTKEGSRKRSPEGEVRVILERSNPTVLARLKQVDTTAVRAIPMDDRLLFELDLPEDTGLESEVEKLVHVAVTRYPIGQHRPRGKIAQILGTDTEAADIDIVSCKHDLPRGFSDEALSEATKFSTKISKAELKKRIDLRDVLTITVKADADAGNHDSIDDAITIEKTEEDHWYLGIHIADVAHYVSAGSAIDREAKRRGVSVYLGDQIVPMLPDQLAHDLCAFLVGQERLAISVLVTLDNDGNVLEYEVQPTVIMVDYQLTYQQSQAILERDDQSAKDLKEFSEVFEMMDQISTLSHLLRDQRYQRGAFDLNLPEKPIANIMDESAKSLFTPKFHYDDEGALSAMVVTPSVPTYTLLAELMLLTNQVIAEHLQGLGVPNVYRAHPAPDPEDAQELMKLAVNMGIDLHLENEEVVRPQDYLAFTRELAKSDAERVLTYLLLETLKPAFYSTSPKPHFGLALDQGYTHFTSPVRRYPDLLIHRVIHAVFEEGRDRKSSRSKEVVDLRHSSCHEEISWNVLAPELQGDLETEFASVVVHLSEREKLAQEAEKDLEGLKKAELMRERTGEIFHGLITGVQSYGLFVEIEELLVEGLVHVSSLKDDWYEFRSRQQTLVGRKNRKQYRLGDRIEVQVKSVDYYRQQIDLVTLGSGSEMDPDESGEGEDAASHTPDDFGAGFNDD